MFGGAEQIKTGNCRAKLGFGQVRVEVIVEREHLVVRWRVVCLNNKGVCLQGPHSLYGCSREVPAPDLITQLSITMFHLLHVIR